MRYSEYIPAPDVRVLAERYWSLEGAGEGVGPILPDGHPELVIHLSDRPVHAGSRQSACLFIGQMRKATVLETRGSVCAWGIRFHPHVGRSITGGIAQWRLAGAIHEAEGVCAAASIRALREALGNAPDSGGRARITDAWLRDRALSVPAGVVGPGLRLLPAMSVESAAARLGCTRRTIERAFSNDVGLTPRAWARIVRLQAALQTREAHPEWTWADIAAESGYADQPHMALEFRQIAGSAPSRLLPAILSHSSGTDIAVPK